MEKIISDNEEMFFIPSVLRIALFFFPFLFFGRGGGVNQLFPTVIRRSL